MPPALQFLVLTFAGWVNRHQDDLIAYLREENRVLREHLGPRPLRLTDAQRRRLAVRGQKLGRRVWMQVAGIVTPDTILRWYRRLIAQTYDGSARRGRGRPMTRRDVAALVVQMAVEKPQWGYTRIRGALSNLGHEIARTTVKRIRSDCLLHDLFRLPAAVGQSCNTTALTVDRDEDFVQKPRISESTLTSLQPPGVIGAELPAPLPNSFVRHDDAAFGQQILDIPEAQAVSVIHPDGVADDFRRKAMPKVAGSSNVHPGIVPRGELT